ncbi:MAG: sugar ABC transporter permease [Chloroflexi bacterium]|nr:sugar ABC transporter permease [Chloroflexota bacterium]
MVAPAVLFVATLVAYPVGYALYLAVTSWTPAGNDGFAGLANFRRMLDDGVFLIAMRVTLQLFVACLIVQTVLGTWLAFLLNKQIRGARIARSIVLMPSIIAPVAAALMWLLLYDPTLGMANFVLSTVGISSVDWLGRPDLVVWSIALVDVWQWTPFIALIVLAGLQTVPEEPLEAAAIDGATAWQRARYVTLPMLWPVITVAMLLRSLDLLRFFDTVLVMTQGGPLNQSTTINVYGYLQGFRFFDMSYAAALQLALMGVVLVVAGFMARLQARSAEYAG